MQEIIIIAGPNGAGKQRDQMEPYKLRAKG
jgi:hypothetical protein